jgi:site-specific recombinase XerC
MHAVIHTHLLELEVAHYAPGTLAIKDAVLARYVAVVGDPLRADEAAAEAWYGGLGSVAAGTASTYLGHVRTFYRWAARRDLRADDPTRRIVVPRARARLPRPVPYPAALALFEALAAPADRLAIGLMFGCGLRCAEVAGADREHYDGALLWVLGKGERPRAVPVPVVLAALIETCPPGPLLSGPHGRLSAERVSARYARVLRRHGLLATCHQLRHTYGTEAYRRLGDLRAVAVLMGHSAISTTAGYVAVELSSAGAALADLAG